MAGYDDPRFLRTQIEGQQRQLDELRKAIMPFAANQRGAIPGALRAVSIGDQGTKGSMWLNFNNLGPGQGPYGAVTDANGVIRVEWGNLAANGNSPAQYGERVNGANGGPIFDSQGLIQVANELGSALNFGPYSNSSTTDVVVTGVTTTFSLARATNVQILVTGSGKLTGTGGSFSYLTVYIDGVNFGHINNGAKIVFDVANPGYTNGNIVMVRNLAAGSHTIDVRSVVDANTMTWTLYQVTLDVVGQGA